MKKTQQKIFFHSSETIDSATLSADVILSSKKYFKNLSKYIWRYQKNKFIFALQNKILNNKHVTQSTTY